MAIQIVINYDIKKGDFSQIVRAIKAHITPQEEKRASPRTLFFLDKINEQLPENPEPYKNLFVRDLATQAAASIAKDLNRFRPIADYNKETNFDDEYEFFKERYFIPSPGGWGMTNAFSMDIFGTQVNECGPYPLTIRMIGDFANMTDQLYLLKQTKKLIQEKGLNGLAEWKKSSIKRVRQIDCNSGTGLEDAILATPLTEEDVQKEIDTLNLQITSLGMTQAVNGMRFYWDVFGLPIANLGHQYKEMITQGGNIDWKVTPEHLAEIIKYPTQTPEQLARKIYLEKKELGRTHKIAVA